MPKHTTTLPSKLMIAFGILLIVSLIAILFFLDHMFSQRIGEEIYLRIHNGGKAVMHVIQNDLDDLELYLSEAEARPPLKPSQKFEAFCAERNIDFLCFQPYLDEPGKTVTLCETKKQTYCQGTPKTSSPQLGALLGIETYEGLPHLEVERPTSLDGSRGVWKIGKAFTAEMIAAFRNLTAMEIFLLLRGKESPGLSTLSRETQPFQAFEDLPLEARDTLNQYAVYTFRHHVNGESYQFITYPLLNLENKVIGALSVGFSLQAIISSNQSTYIISGIFVAFIILAFLGVSIAVTRYFLQPLVDLKSTVNRFLHEKQTNNTLDDQIDAQVFKDTCTGRMIEVSVRETDKGNNDVIVAFTAKDEPEDTLHEQNKTGKEVTKGSNAYQQSIEAQASLKCAKVVVASMVNSESTVEYVKDLLTTIAEHSFKTLQDLKK